MPDLINIAHFMSVYRYQNQLGDTFPVPKKQAFNWLRLQVTFLVIFCYQNHDKYHRQQSFL